MPPIGQPTSTPPSKPPLSTTNSTQTRLPLWKTWAKRAVLARHQGTFNPGYNPTPTPPPPNHRNGYIDVNPNDGYLEIGEKPETKQPTPPTQIQTLAVSKYFKTTGALFVAAGVENLVRMPFANVGLLYEGGAQYKDAFKQVKGNLFAAYGGTVKAAGFSVLSRGLQRFFCFETPEYLKENLAGYSDTTKIAAQTVAVTALEATISTPIERALLLLQKNITKSFFEAFNETHMKSAYNPFGAIIARNLSFNFAFMVAMHTKPENETLQIPHKIAAAGICVFISQPFERYRFVCSEGMSYKNATKQFMKEGLPSLVKGGLIRTASVGTGLFLSWFAYSQIKEMINGKK